eukprot:TRINITY_DN27889_c4_g1_i1.p1 TRINITY_DN27889_c4_g1~~TRINITY_DN27889_c4_g1_i1.p1  ORF type:complete len:619 (-),score=104.44 TRINITY_DN27889_c4_g1_i1:82-1938(-)
MTMPTPTDRISTLEDFFEKSSLADAMKVLTVAQRCVMLELASLREENRNLQSKVDAFLKRGDRCGDVPCAKAAPRNAKHASKADLSLSECGTSQFCTSNDAIKEQARHGPSLSMTLRQFPSPTPPCPQPLPEFQSSTSVKSSCCSLAGGVQRCVVFDTSEQSVEFFLHDSVLQKLHYFEIRAARWQSDAAIELHLPSHCPHRAFSALLQRLYSTSVRWSPADWIELLGADIGTVYGTLLLVKMLLASDLVPEVLATLRHLSSDAESVAWLRDALQTVELPELQGFNEADLLEVSSETLKEAALSAVKGSPEGRQLLEALLLKRDTINVVAGDTTTLISVLQDCASYVSHRCTQSCQNVHSSRALGLSSDAAYKAWACHFVKPFRIPVHGFEWLWQLLLGRIEQEPHLFAPSILVFKTMQWLESEVAANRKGQESLRGSRTLLHIPEARSKQAIRRAFSQFLLLGVQLNSRGHLHDDALMEAFSLGTHTSAQAPAGLVAGKRRNLLSFQQQPHRTSCVFVDDVDLLCGVLCGVGHRLADRLLGCIADFKDFQWSFSPDTVRGISDEQQVVCAASSSTKWLTGDICRAFRKDARATARLRLAPFMGSLDADQRAFMWEGL